RMQSDLLNLRDPAESSPQPVEPTDDSIQVHCCAGALREVETLTLLADKPDQPGLHKELGLLKQSFKDRVVPSRISSLTQNLKNMVIRMDTGTPDIKAAEAEAGPEGLEDNVRDILMYLVNDFSAFEEPGLQQKAKDLARKIAAEFTLEDFKPFIQEIHDLIFVLKEMIREERRELYKFTQDIMSRLEDTENDLVQTLDSSREHIGTVESEFERKVAVEINDIESTFDISGLSLEDVRSRVFDKIANLRLRFQEKRLADEARMRCFEEEKTKAEKRFQDIHSRYQEFTKRSEKALKDMEKFRQASLRDGLTRIYNRRAYDLQIEKAVEEFRAGRLSGFCLMIFDIDHFKDFNNNYGHRAGDKTLKYVAKMTAQSVRRQDFVARYGGDEFVLILPEIDLKNAAGIADKLRTDIGGVEFKIYRDRDISVKVGLSVGVAVSRKGDKGKDIFQRADQALYLAKEKGRNQVRTEKELSERTQPGLIYRF
ncbi:MAG: diguanylate cyclase, partial [Thermodesulfobacteriota bacterium]|nr:diguanylate cyclase [Thermodesulfobacteriota bacterium]